MFHLEELPAARVSLSSRDHVYCIIIRVIHSSLHCGELVASNGLDIMKHWKYFSLVNCSKIIFVALVSSKDWHAPKAEFVSLCQICLMFSVTRYQRVDTA